MKFIIPGNPVPLARPRMSTKNRMVYSTQNRLRVHAAIYMQSQVTSEHPLSGPLQLDITFYLRPPALSAKKVAQRIDAYHYCKPDLSNLIKFIEDAANKIIYNDDAQICIINARKVYHEEARTEFTVTPIDPEKKLSK